MSNLSAPLQDRVVPPEHAKQFFLEHEFGIQMPRLLVEPAEREIGAILIEQVERLLTVGGQDLQRHIGRQLS